MHHPKARKREHFGEESRFAATGDGRQEGNQVRPAFVTSGMRPCVRQRSPSPTRPSAAGPTSWGGTDPTKLVLNVRFTDDLETAEAELRELWGGALCVSLAERSLADLQAIQAELSGADVTMSSINQAVNAVEVQVVVADPALQADYDARYGDGAVDVAGWLQPVG
jgi:hypothetical protein